MKDAPFAILHDGVITGITGDIPGKIVLEVKCDYLRTRHPAPGDSFLLELTDCRKLVFTDDLKVITSDFQSIVHHKPEMLSADNVGSDVLIFCTCGTLHLDFRDIAVYLNPTQAISVDDLETLARKYWDDWEEEAKKNPISEHPGNFSS